MRQLLNRGIHKKQSTQALWSVKRDNVNHARCPILLKYAQAPRYQQLLREPMRNRVLSATPPASAPPPCPITEKLWNEANKAMAGRDLPQETRLTRNKHELALKGILKCGRCGCAMSPKPGGKKDANGHKRPYYTCQNVIRHGASCDCQVRNLPGKAFDDFITK